jgi:predicted amidohydrolase YtcJ
MDRAEPDGTPRSRRTRLVVDGMYLPEPSDMRVLVWEGTRIVWVGRDPDRAPPVAVSIDLPGAWVTPGFVDAHVHATATGLTLDGLDLAGTRSADEMTARLHAFASRCDDDPIVGGGWQEHDWPVPHPPSADEVARAAPGRRVVLNRIDGHSCVVDPATLALVVRDSDDGVDRDAEHRPTGWLREDAAQRARRRVWQRLPDERLARARHATVMHAAGLGITSIHEMGHPGLSSLDDALAWAQGEWPVEVLVWWADIDPAVALAHDLRPGGDLFLDGAIGSRTAAVSEGYRDGPALGGLFHSDDEVQRFFVRCTRTQVGGAVHAIGDAAIAQAIAGIEAAASDAGVAAVRACRHRIEHVELPRPEHARRMARLGVVASMQPMFDAYWGGPDGMYARRFGREVALASNPFATLAGAGCQLAFSSDTPVTPMAPWEGVVAATAHRGGRSLNTAAALTAATVGGRYAAHQDDAGPLRAGNRADLAVWDGDPLAAGGTRRCAGIVVRGQLTKSNGSSSLSSFSSR